MERPILFSGPMIGPIQRDTKTVTRRLFRQAHDLGGHPADAVCEAADGSWIPWWGPTDAETLAEFTRRKYPSGGFRCPYGGAGDRLWVRETWQCFDPTGTNRIISATPRPGICSIGYKADEPERAAKYGHPFAGPWRPSIFMPRWASRLTLEVVSVRPERLHAITEEDAIREGAFRKDYGFAHWYGARNPGWSMRETTSSDECMATARGAFAHAWRQINGKRAPWESNPWIWRVEFRRVEAA